MFEFTRRLFLTATCSLILPAVLQVHGVVWAAPALEYSKTGCICIPNATNYGYFRTSWRQWPGERRLDKTFPNAIGAEQLPAPPAQEELPQDVQEPAGGPGGVEKLPDQVPAEGGILPPERRVPSDEGLPRLPGVLEQPAEPPGGPAREPPLEGGLPGLGEQPDELLPLQPGEEGGLPGLGDQPDDLSPLEPGEEGGLPGLPLDSTDEGIPPAEQPFEAEPPGTGPDSSEDRGLQLRRPEVAGVDRGLKGRGAGRLRKNWISALHPRFRGDADGPALTYPSEIPARQAMHEESFHPRAQLPPARPTKPAAGASAVRRTRVHAFGGSGEQPVEQAGHLQDVQSNPPGSLHGVPGQGGGPTVALEGYCPVALSMEERWIPGDVGWAVEYRGRIYLFSGAAEGELFLADPERYCPAYCGYDPVLAVDAKRNVPGQIDYCATYRGRLYLFSGPKTMARFRAHPHRYTLGGSAMTSR